MVGTAIYWIMAAPGFLMFLYLVFEYRRSSGWAWEEDRFRLNYFSLVYVANTMSLFAWVSKFNEAFVIAPVIVEGLLVALMPLMQIRLKINEGIMRRRIEEIRQEYGIFGPYL